MIRIKHKGNFNKTEKFLSEAQKINIARLLIPYGQRGVQALAQATPKHSGEAALSWSYEVSATNANVRITWSNSKMAGNVPLVALIYYGHGTGGGGYVQGQDFITPALQPIFEQIINDAWREVTRL